MTITNSTQEDRDSDEIQVIRTHEFEGVNENTPLKPQPQKRTPLPKLQLFIVFLIQFSEPVAATVIYPFVNQFVRSTGITGGDEKKTGYYAGVIESVFFLAEAITVLQWGRLSDRIGRKPVLLFGPLGLGFAMTAFGMSKSFWMLVVSRCLQGAFNGNIGVSKTVLVEISDHTNLADAYAMIPLMWTTGITIGPIIGGVLSNPADRWPSSLGKLAFLKDHPYFLPCAAAALLAFFSAGMAAVALTETLPSAIRRKKEKAASSQPSSGSSTPSMNEHQEPNYGSTGLESENLLEEQSAETQKDQDVEKPPAFSDLLIPQVLRPLHVFAYIEFIDMCSSVLMPLVFSTSTQLGGAGFDPYQIGMILGIWGGLNAIVQATCLGHAIRWIGPTRMVIVSFMSYFVVFGLYPVMGYFARKKGYADGCVWGVIVLQLVCMVTNNAAYAACQIIIVDNTPSRAALASANGMSQAVGSGVRSIAPTFASSLFSVALEKHLAGGNAAYFVLMAITLWGIKDAVVLPRYLKVKGSQ